MIFNWFFFTFSGTQLNQTTIEKNIWISEKICSQTGSSYIFEGIKQDWQNNCQN